MRRFELNEKGAEFAEFMEDYLWRNGYASMVHGDVIISSDDEDIEVKTILDDNGIKYMEGNLHADEILLEISAQLDVVSGEEIPTAWVTLMSGRYIEVEYVADCFNRNFFCVKFHSKDKEFYNANEDVVYLRCTRTCTFDELHLITDYINEILDMENVGA